MKTLGLINNIEDYQKVYNEFRLKKIGEASTAVVDPWYLKVDVAGSYVVDRTCQYPMLIM